MNYIYLMREDLRIRSAQEVAERTIALIGVFQAATGRKKKQVSNLFKENNMWSFLSPIEQKFLLEEENDSPYLSIQLSWRAEAVYILLWVLNQLEFTQIPSNDHNLKQIIDLLRDDEFFTQIPLEDAQLRDSEDILNMLEKVYKIHWEIRDAQINQKPLDSAYNPTIIYEWHYSLNWVTNANEDWDDITTDT